MDFSGKISKFPEILNFNEFISQTQPVHLQLTNRGFFLNIELVRKSINHGDELIRW